MLRPPQTPPHRSPLFQFGSFTFDAEDGTLKHGGKRIHLQRKGAKLLALLLEEPGRVFSRQDLMSAIWSASVVDSALDFQIHAIRKALHPDGDELLTNVRGHGFRFEGEVTRVLRQSVGAAHTPLSNPLESVGASPVIAVSSDHRRVSGLIVAGGVACVVAISLGLGFQSSTARISIVESKPINHGGTPEIGIPVLTDGNQVYFRRIPDDKYLVVPASGGEPQPAFDPGSPFFLTDAGQGSDDNIAIRFEPGVAEGDVWVVPKTAGIAPHRVGNLKAIDAVASPDRRRLALVAGGQLVLSDIDGTNVTPVSVSRKGVVLYPRWSPDGGRVRFTLNEPSDGILPTSQMWEVARQGGQPELVFPNGAPTPHTCCGVWSPDGNYFVFQVWRGDGRHDLWVRHESRGFQSWLQPATIMPLTSGPLSVTGPAVGADNLTIYAVGALIQGQLVRWDQSVRSFVPYLGGISGTWVTFSPDRQWIAYAGYPDRKLWRARADGTDQRSLVAGDFELDGVTWSPDGRWLAFRSRMAGRRMKIFLIPAEGGQPVAITGEDRDQGVASWSADANRIVFGDVPPQFGVSQGTEVLHIYDLRDRSFSTVPGSERMWTARWSPDGRYIAALTIDPEQRMKVFDTRSAQWRALDAVHVDNPSWSPDSQFVYYDTEGSTLSLRRVRVADDHVEELTSIDFLMAVAGWSGLSPDGSPLILKNLTAPAVYAFTLERRR